MRSRQDTFALPDSPRGRESWNRVHGRSWLEISTPSVVTSSQMALPRWGEALPNWGDAVLEILKTAGIPEARVAAELDLPRPITYRHIHGDRRPSDEMVKRINHAVAVITNDPQLEEYLDIIHALDTGKVLSSLVSKPGPARILQSLRFYLRDGYIQTFMDLIGSWDDDRSHRFMLELAAYGRRWTFNHQTGGALPTTTLQHLAPLFEKYGFDWRAWLRPRGECLEHYARSTFFKRLDGHLGRATSDHELRIEIASDIGADLAHYIAHITKDKYSERLIAKIRLPWEAPQRRSMSRKPKPPHRKKRARK